MPAHLFESWPAPEPAHFYPSLRVTSGCPPPPPPPRQQQQKQRKQQQQQQQQRTWAPDRRSPSAALSGRGAACRLSWAAQPRSNSCPVRTSQTGQTTAAQPRANSRSVLTTSVSVVAFAHTGARTHPAARAHQTSLLRSVFMTCAYVHSSRGVPRTHRP